jgi:site-specific DNA recombinase
MRVVIYIRVSTPGQALEDKYSLRAQKEELTSYAKKKDWVIVDTIQDIDKGGDFAKDGLKNLMEIADSGKMDVALVFDQSRLSRLDGIHWEMLKAVLKQNNVRLAEPGRMIDLNDDIQEMFSDLQNWFSRRGKKDIVKTMMRGKRQMLREGRPWGQVPFEYIYDKENKSIEPHPSYTWVIPTIDDLYLNKQMGLVAIARHLDTIMLTPTGKHWNEKLVHDRIRNKAYHGIMEKRFATGEVITQDNMYPAMRSEQTFLALQEEIKRRGHMAVKKSKDGHIHMLRRTVINCGECGRLIGVANHSVGSKRKYYLKHGRKLRVATREVCDISINTIRIDQNIITALKDILTDEEKARKYIQLDVDDEMLTGLKKEAKALETQIKQIDQKIDRLLDLYLDGAFDKSSLENKKSTLSNERTVLDNRLSKIQSKLELAEKKRWNYSLVSKYLSIAANFDKKLTELEIAHMIGNLFPSATLYKDKLVLHGELSNGAPLDVSVKIDADPYPYHNSKKHKNWF